MSAQSTAGKPWYWDKTRRRVQVKDLRPGDVITGTGPSGDYETGPVTVKRLVPIPRLGHRPEFLIELIGGESLTYYGETVVELGKR